MKCLNPTTAFICGTRRTKDGIISPDLVFSTRAALEYYTKILGSEILAGKALESHQVDVPCGHCACCQIRKRKDYSVRLANEASVHQKCCFITLTYSDDTVPVTDWNKIGTPSKQFSRGLGELPELTLCPADVQKFMKRLRRHLEYLPKIKLDNRDHVDHPIRYFCCGEYGSRTHRPHYHIIIFGWSPSDLELLKSHNGNPVYTSAQLQKLWPFGYSSVSDVNSYVARYASRYVTKKMERLDTLESEDVSEMSRVPEFTLSSKRNGGIGAPWFDMYGCESCLTRRVNVASPSGRVTSYSVPNYYWTRLRRFYPDVFLRCRNEKVQWLKEHKGVRTTYDDIVRSVECFRYNEKLKNESEVF